MPPENLTRRRWLAGMSLAACVAPARADAPKPAPLGFSLYGMKALKLGPALEAVASVGYDGVELALMPGYPTEPKLLSSSDRTALRKQLGDRGLALHSLMENLPQPADAAAHAAQLDRLKAAAALAHALAPAAPPPVETVLGGKPADWPQARGRMLERLGAWADVARAERVVVAVKPHVGNALHSVEGALGLVEELKSPWLKLAFDYSHFALRGVKLEAATAALLPHAAMVHVKDARGAPAKFEFLLPGTEGTDYAAYARLLAAARYAGPVVVEVSGMISDKPGYDPVAAARTSYANLAAAFGRPKR